MAAITLPANGWKPRHYQERTWAYLSSGGRRAVLKFHRRAGKDELCLQHMACAAFERPANYWMCLPQYSQARKSMWDGVNSHSGKKRIDEVFPKEIRKSTHEQEMKITFYNGSTFQLVGSDNPDSLVGSPPLGIVFSEYALSNPSAWGYLRPILLENGGWAAFNSTPRGNNHFKNLCKMAEKSQADGGEWFYESKTVDETGVFTVEQLADELREMQSDHGDDYGKSLFLQEYYCSFDAAIPGSVWGDCLDKLQLRGKIGVVPPEPMAPVHTGWDLGRTDATAIWFFQMFGGEIRVIDYHESTLKDIPFYADLLRGKPRSGDADKVARLKERTKTYKYGTHWLPHDARARTLAAGGKSIQQQMIDEKVGRIVIAKRLDHQDGIQAARATFPHCWFDAERCEDGLEVLRNYHYEWDEEKKIFSNMPAHDWSSHGSSAFRTLSLSWKHPKNAAPDAPLEQRLLDSSITNKTFGALKAMHFKRKRSERELRH